MFAETVIGHINLYEQQTRKRSHWREFNSEFYLRLSFREINSVHDKDGLKRGLSEKIFRCALWNEGEKIISLIEAGMSKERVKGQEDYCDCCSIPLTRDAFSNVIKSIASNSSKQNQDKGRNALEPPAGPYAFDLAIHQREQRRVSVFSLIYGISARRDALDQWRSEASIMSSLSVRLAQQYYDIDIDHCEFALIDPLLLESQVEEGIWALADLDCLAGRTGVAEKVLNAQKTLRKELIKGLGDIFAETEAEQARLIDEEVAKIAVEALDQMPTSKIQILTPDNVVEPT